MRVIRNITFIGIFSLLSLAARANDIPDWINLPTYDCRACHTIDKKLVGPAWKDVAVKYKGDSKAKDMLKTKVKAGGKGNWTEVTGGMAMTPHPNLTDEQLEKVVSYVLSLAK